MDGGTAGKSLAQTPSQLLLNRRRKNVAATCPGTCLLNPLAKRRFARLDFSNATLDVRTRHIASGLTAAGPRDGRVTEILQGAFTCALRTGVSRRRAPI